MTRLALSCGMLATGAGLVAAAVAHGGATDSAIRRGGTFRVVVNSPTGSVDPAVPGGEDFSLLETTCAKLMTYPDRRPPRGHRLTPELAAAFPRVSNGGKTYTFTLRRGARFSNGRPVQATAFQWAFTRILRIPDAEDAYALIQEIAGASRVRDGSAQTASGVSARGNRLTIRLTRPVPTLPARMAAPWYCAVPPGLPIDPEGAPAPIHSAGPYYVAANVRGRRVVLRRNRFYRGPRPRHVDAIVAQGGLGSFDEVLDRVQRGTADWGWVPPPLLLDPSRRLAARYGVNRSQFWVVPGLILEHYIFNTRRPLFRRNPRLRRAVNFAINRAAIRRALGGRLASRLTDQYLPPSFPAFRDARIYPLTRPNVRRARALARGNRRSGKVVLYTIGVPPVLAAAQAIKRDLARIGLDVEIQGFPPQGYVGRVLGNEPWDIARLGWVPDHLDPFTYLNLLFGGGSEFNAGSFNEATYNRLLRRAARLRGAARDRAYGALDVRLAREAAPSAAIHYFNDLTFVSRRVDPRCVVLRPSATGAALVLNAVCLK